MIDADDPLVADLLGGTIELVREAGGFVAPITRLVERGGQLSIESSAAAGEPLLRIPREAFVRVDRVEWSQDGDRIVIEQVPDDCGLNCDSENGLSFGTCGREWLLVTPRSASRNATGLDAIDEPRSACKVSWSGSMECLVTVSSMSSCARVARSFGASIQPTTYRE